jgi:voltage-gated potassium channel
MVNLEYTVHRIRNALVNDFAKITYAILAIIAYGTISEYYIERSIPGSGIKTLFDSLWFVMQTITTVGYGSNLPITTLGKTNAMVIMVLGISMLGFFAATGASYMVNNVILQKTGDKRSRMTDHVIICNWNSRAEGLVKQLIFEHVHKIVLLANLEERPIPNVEFIKGSCLRTKDLEKANAQYAKTFVILANNEIDKHANPGAVDASSILGVMNARKTNTDANITVELLQRESVDNARDSGADDIILGDLMATNLLAKGILHPGTVTLFEILLSPKYKEGIYETRLPMWARELQYKQIAEYMEQFNLTPLAVRGRKGLQINPHRDLKMDYDSILYLGDKKIQLPKTYDKKLIKLD